MRQLILLALVGAGAYYGFKRYALGSEAYRAYGKYAEAYRFGKCPELRALSEGAAAADVEQYCTGSTFMGRQLPSAASMANDMAMTPSGVMLKIVRKVESESQGSDGVVTLKLVETPGGPAARDPAMRFPPRKVVARLRQSGAAWKVIEAVDPDAPPKPAEPQQSAP